VTLAEPHTDADAAICVDGQTAARRVVTPAAGIPGTQGYMRWDTSQDEQLAEGIDDVDCPHGWPGSHG
jgi:hypothetical protein